MVNFKKQFNNSSEVMRRDHRDIDKSYFKPECLEKIKQILSDPKPGVYKIGEAYNG